MQHSSRNMKTYIEAMGRCYARPSLQLHHDSLRQPKPMVKSQDLARVTIYGGLKNCRNIEKSVMRSIGFRQTSCFLEAHLFCPKFDLLRLCSKNILKLYVSLRGFSNAMMTRYAARLRVIALHVIHLARDRLWSSSLHSIPSPRDRERICWDSVCSRAESLSTPSKDQDIFCMQADLSGDSDRPRPTGRTGHRWQGFC